MTTTAAALTTPETETGNPLARKLAAITSQIDRVAKSGHNDFHNYDYSKESDLLEAVRGKLAAANISIVPRAIPESMVITPGCGKSHDEIVTTLMVEFTIIDGDSEVREIGCYPGAGSDKLDKGPYKAVTGATKYFLQKLFLIPMGDDPEVGSAPPQGRPLAAAQLTMPPRTNPTPPAARPAPPAPPAAGPRPLAAPAAQAAQSAPRASSAPAGAQAARPLGNVATARVTATPAPAARPAPSPAGPRPLAPALETVARQMAAIAAEPAAVGLTQVFERQRGTHPTQGTYVLWTVLTDAGQKLAALDDDQASVGAALKAAADAGQRVVLTVEQHAAGPKITDFRVSGAPASYLGVRS
jgi:hypothetical protein